MRFVGVGLVLISGLHASAFGQPSQVPEPCEPEPYEAKWRLEGGLVVGMPLGDLDEENTSSGYGFSVARTVASRVSLFGAYRFIRIETNSMAGGERYQLRHYDVQLGVRYTIPATRNLHLFAEAHVDFAVFSIGHPEYAGGLNGALSAGGFGFGMRAGALAVVRETVGIGAAIGNSWAMIDPVEDLGRFGDPSFWDAWLTFETFAHVTF